jgi:hypothetical protein
MAVAVGFHPEALEESAAAERWYRERSDTAAEAFVAERDGLFCVGFRSQSSFARHRRAPRSSLSRMVGDVPATGSTAERRIGSRSVRQRDPVVGLCCHAACLRTRRANPART